MTVQDTKQNKNLFSKIKHSLQASSRHSRSFSALDSLQASRQHPPNASQIISKFPIYNPYGINNRHSYSVQLASPAADGTSDSPITLPYPIDSPKDHVPQPFQNEIEDLDQMYEIADSGSFLGSGGSSTIRKVQRRTDKKVVALKVFNVFKDEAPGSYYRRVAHEYIITKSLAHVHVITVYELVRLPTILSRNWGMVMEYYPHDLYNVLRQPHWQAISLGEKLCYFKQLVFGLYHLHLHDIVHLDLKPGNILLEHGVLKITDFGCGDYGHVSPGRFESGVRMCDKILGTPPFQSPEVTMLRNAKGHYDPFKADCWSLGMMLFSIVKGRVPFKEAQRLDKDYADYEHESRWYKDLNPSFVHNDARKVPNRGPLAHELPHGQLTRLFWRLCDPVAATRMSMKEVFASDYFQKIAMCFKEETHGDGVSILDETGTVVESSGLGVVAEVHDVHLAIGCRMEKHLHDI
ncbi:hypothetical protein KL918_002407 [Ogataea parapolymorpha]|uniref:Protein kinase domain-containing protein n=1 Tax=Ogataea parapolymorpha (strain ATCC 26012 / BCRC 20466 / JCM 22074 / NRRL Y-7560 / DL-1) TaxID=871575 RepID=W1QKN6_OGAPD|nr:hypothetical protein HPODL_02139 [Ogataea parapolymorpha DL-1]ESX02821.1 hypothetical protein HPODL_02139 [Ogataea parapolymorpha DL-1]KAG7867810.1 hypothetical protein KL918_002407 [Ogataea parapolymorpha]KAG7870749.1 hypothetical protein KL916_004797 [Ogataea parapolymorpha]